jgi:hypothetical protein
MMWVALPLFQDKIGASCGREVKREIHEAMSHQCPLEQKKRACISVSP